MAKLESRTIQVHPKNENATIAHMERFGWELKNAQDVVTKDSHDELWGDTIYSVTETERYIKLMFQRDTEGEKYAWYCKGEALNDEIEELRRKSKHYDFSFKIWPDMPKWLYIVICVISYFVGTAIATTVFADSFPISMLVCVAVVLLLVAAAIIFVRIKFVRPKEKASYNEWLISVEEARKLLIQKEAELKELGF